jgi:uncharacterized ferritin-like protein (DUF455 family)
MTAVDAAIPPPEGTVERWAWDYVSGDALEAKLAPPPLPRRWEVDAPERRIARPGRPADLVIVARAPKSPGPEALRDPKRRAQLLHGFLHHELQAAELLAWALLAFPETPRPFRRGLAAVLHDEARHMRAYAALLADLGHRFGDFPVRDWFWERVPRARSAADFVAVLGIGFEGGNLDHAARFTARLLAVGDARAAEVQARIGREEEPHVRFAWRWFRHFTGKDDFATWASHLPPPLSPLLMRGKHIERTARLRAGLPAAFIDELETWNAIAPGS